jgi:hypothetical protein
MFFAFFLQTGVLALTVPKPSVPEFTVRYFLYSRDVDPVYEFDPFTGQNVMTSKGHTDTDRIIELTIINQPFTPITLSNGSKIEVYYGVRSKPHFSNIWNEYEASPENYTPHSDVWPASASEDTTVINYVLGGPSARLDDGDIIDFQVRARVGYKYYVAPLGNLFEDLGDSEWSSIQTVTIGNEATSPPTATPVPTPSTLPPQNPTSTPFSSIDEGSSFSLNLEQSALLVAFVLIAVLSISMIIMWSKIARHKKIVT